jgi:hypothetical protein
MIRRALVVSVLALFAGSVVAAQQPAAKPAPVRGILDGVVTDTSLVPLGNAEVLVVGSSLRLATGASGRFRFVDVPPGQWVVMVRHVGYEPMTIVVDVNGADTLRLSFALEHTATTLGTVTVAAKGGSPRMAEFDERRKNGLGQFLTQDDIAKHNALRATELIRTISSVNVRGTAPKGGNPAWVAYSYRPGGSGGGRRSGGLLCEFQVVVDDIPMPAGYNLDDLPGPKDIAGIEVYSGPATIPLQFKGFDRSCGVILVWTKDR